MAKSNGIVLHTALMDAFVSMCVVRVALSVSVSVYV